MTQTTKNEHKSKIQAEVIAPLPETEPNTSTASETEKVKESLTAASEKVKTTTGPIWKKLKLALIVIVVLALVGAAAYYWREIVYTYGYFFKPRNYYMRVDEVREDVTYLFYYNGRVELSAESANYFENTMVRLSLKDVIAQRLLIENVDNDYYTRYHFTDKPEYVVVWDIHDESNTLYDESGRNTSEAARELVTAWQALEKPAVLRDAARAAAVPTPPPAAVSGEATTDSKVAAAPNATPANGLSAKPTASGSVETQTSKTANTETTQQTISTGASNTQSSGNGTTSSNNGKTADVAAPNSGSRKLDDNASLERLTIRNGKNTQAAWNGYYYYIAKTANGNTLARISVDTMQTASQADRVLDGVDAKMQLATTGEALYIWTRKGQDFVLYRLGADAAAPKQVLQDTMGSLNGVRAEASHVDGRAAEIIYVFEENNQSENGVIYYYMPAPDVLAEISKYTANAYGDNMLIGVTGKDAFLLAKVDGGSNGLIKEIFSLEYDHNNGQLVRNSLASGESMPKSGNFYTCKAYSAPTYNATSNTLEIDSLGRVYRYNLNNNTLTMTEDGNTQSKECQ